jgi:hypothetical protein
MATKFKRYREESRSNWGAELEEGTELDREQIQLGAILRIADATEAMAKNVTQLEASLKYYRGRTEELEAEIKRLGRSVRAYRGLLKRRKA